MRVGDTWREDVMRVKGGPHHNRHSAQWLLSAWERGVGGEDRAHHNMSLSTRLGKKGVGQKRAEI